jgi:4-hydroxy-2-oxoheptanedioate aldolase
MGSHFKEHLYDPAARLIGMFVKFPTIETVEILASLGCDFVIIDMEHVPLNVETVYHMIVASERSGMAALVRVCGHETSMANMFLDAGASGILIPHCSPYETAKKLITDMVFPPTGNRGAGGGGRATRWGIDDLAEYRRGGESGIVRVPMIEDPEAVDIIDQILTVPGVDAVFVGQGDLTQTLGDPAKAQVLVDKVLDACLKKGIPTCITAYGDEIEARFRQGFKWLAIANDMGIFTGSAKDRLAAARLAADRIR